MMMCLLSRDGINIENSDELNMLTIMYHYIYVNILDKVNLVS